MLAAGILAASFVAVCAVPLSAQATSTGKCIWYDFDVQPTTPGAPRAPLEDCALHPDWPAEASYYWDKQKTVVFEPWTQQFDYSAFSQLNPFTGDGYSLRKANELFPDRSDEAYVRIVMEYAQMSLTAKARALEQRRGVTAADACQVVPTLWSDSEIRDWEAVGLLPPSPRPDGKTGTYTYSFSTTLTAEQRSVVSAGLVAFADAIDGSRQPRLVEWVSGDLNPPVITFTNAPGGFDDPDLMARAISVSNDNGRDGLPRWFNGNIELNDKPGSLSLWTVMHEILHVYGFGHLAPAVNPQVMSGELPSPDYLKRGLWGADPVLPINGKADACTKVGIDAAAAPE
ncbi:hypothetical protein B7R54_02805 [Subtercola boreus]|uniref:Peptidase M10 metallopeptidase domain-containing protein n=1 Tax=Subtercola boreus TaxID=120213 RepID=A0A3E0VEW0_9MICO|nr:hypothetical protein [Subtercola boreus]RFA08271.1 hypothetical protein B7R54_02805 [Subtercola boreus]TQL54833.1 hypothetical protein FB464_2379 [Subtercola boreus]